MNIWRSASAYLELNSSPSPAYELLLEPVWVSGEIQFAVNWKFIRNFIISFLSRKRGIILTSAGVLEEYTVSMNDSQPFQVIGKTPLRGSRNSQVMKMTWVAGAHLVNTPELHVCMLRRKLRRELFVIMVHNYMEEDKLSIKTKINNAVKGGRSQEQSNNSKKQINVAPFSWSSSSWPADVIRQLQELITPLLLICPVFHSLACSD